MKNGSIEVLRREIPSQFRWLGVFDAALQEIGQELEWGQEDLNQVSIAAIEAVSNAIEHGNRYDAKEPVLIEMRVGRNRLQITVADTGTGFDENRLVMMSPNPKDPEFLGSRGRGIFIMRETMDSVRIHRDSGRFYLELEKEITSEPATGE
jgi:serine/threonine-protein kinase RsbW